jgi:hypothetical protein
MFILPMNNTKKSDKPDNLRRTNDISDKLKTNIDFVDALLRPIKSEDPTKSYDINEFNSIQASLNDTRKWLYESKVTYYDYTEYYLYYSKKNFTTSTDKEMLVALNIAFLMQTRYRVAGALEIRKVVQRDKRYKRLWR